MPSSATTRRGMALYRAGRYAGAARALAAAHADDPGDPETAGWLAAALQHAGQTGAGLSVLGAALLRSPDSAGLWEQLGAGLALAGRWREARYAAAEAFRLEPGRPAALKLAERLEAHPERAAERDAVDAALTCLEAGEADAEAVATLLRCHGPARWAGCGRVWPGRRSTSSSPRAIRRRAPGR
ncbi:MAG: tetratricopeptide repeat protein [Armatimonadetes bacterium]|nr:tetratricopeptide repeat protein [Armatimonadota bacterium]